MKIVMTKKVIDLTFDDLAAAGAQAAAMAIAESHEAGQPTWHLSHDGTFEKVRPDGVTETFGRSAAEAAIIGKSHEKKPRRKAAA
jgi:hypothetical protein